MRTAILGLNAYHGDSSACLVRDGRLIAAAEEERFCRMKHWAGFPREAIRYCLAEGGISLADVTHVAINRNPRANLGRKALFTLARRPSLRLVKDRVANARAWQSIDKELAAAFPEESIKAEVVHVEHHLAHLASGFLVSPFRDAAAVSIDGFGDFSSAAWGFGTEEKLAIDDRVLFPHSLGVFYQALTQYLGFPNFGDEYKVMGLAPYGRPVLTDQVGELVHTRPDGSYALNLAYYRHHRERLGYEWRNTVPTMDALYSDQLVRLLGAPRRPEDPIRERHQDIARSVQDVYEDRLFSLLKSVHARYQTDNLVLAGGCAANSVANGKVHTHTPFTRIYIPPAAGDGGGSLGAALFVHRGLGKPPSRFRMTHAYWGPSYGDNAIAAVSGRASSSLRRRARVMEDLDEQSLLDRTARAVSNGEVVGWFQGRMEVGPRALGNRSILCDPRRADIKAILNAKIKRRESFRPFAPSIKREAVGAWFETDAEVPFMNRVFVVRPDKQRLIPAVTHVDGTGRLHTVDAAANPLFHRFITAFEGMTGIPMVLNTSFNENEPIVRAPEEAVDCFLRTEMDLLVLGHSLFARPGSCAVS